MTSKETTFDPGTPDGLLTAVREYIRLVPHLKYPRSFVRLLSDASARRFRSTWRPTPLYATFEDLEASVIDDTEARSTTTTKPTTATPVEAYTRQQIVERLEEDLFNLSCSIPDRYKTELLQTAAMRRCQAAFETAVAKLDVEMSYQSFRNPLSPEEGLIRDPDDVAEPLEHPIAPVPTPDLRARLQLEAEALLPHLLFTIMPTLDMGKRLRGLPARRLFGAADKHRLALQSIQDDIDAANPDLGNAPPDSYMRIPESALLHHVRTRALDGYDTDAKLIYNAIIGYHSSVEEVLNSLRALQVDHDEQVVVPWRAYRLDRARTQTARPSVADGRQTQSGNQGTPREGGSGQCRPSTVSTKPRPVMRQADDDPYWQFKDNKKFAIPATHNQFCAHHGYNASHGTGDCRARKEAEATSTPKTTGSMPAPKTDAKPKSTTDPKPAVPATSGSKSGQTRDAKGRFSKPLDNVTTAANPGPVAIPIEVKGYAQPMPAILDTGAAVSCLSEGTLAKLMSECPILVSASDVTLSGAGQTNIGTGQQAHLSIQLSNIAAQAINVTWAFQVLTGKAHKILVGTDLMWELGLLTPSGLNLKLDPQTTVGEDDGVSHEYLIDNVEAPPGPEQLYGVTIDEDFPLRDRVVNIINTYAEVFEDLHPQGADIPPATIALLPDAQLPNARPRPLRPATLREVHRQLDELDEQGIVRDSHSHVASAAVTADKKGGALRLCADYRDLNKATIPDRFPIADIRTFTQDLAGSKRYFTADLRSGYHQMPMAPEAVPLTALIVPGRFKEYMFAPFGLRNLPSQFQRAIEAVLRPLAKDGTKNYIDDIMGKADDDEALCDRFEAFLRLMSAHRLRLKGTKCHVGTTSVVVLGTLINEDGRAIDPERVRAILDLPSPGSKPGVRMIIGVFNYLADFIPECQTRLQPFHALITGDAPVTKAWTPEHEALFNDLKSTVASDKCLVHPDITKPWRLETDASLAGIGGVLWQLTDDKHWAVVAYFSKAFNDTQRRWCTFDQELFGIVYCLARPDMAPLFKAHYQLVVRTDHRNLTYLHVKATDNRKHLRWLLLLQEYDLTIEHIPGRDNTLADALSRYWSVIDPSVDAVDDSETPEDRRADAIADAHRFHEGINATTENLRTSGHNWPGMRADVTTHVAGCLYCQKARLSSFVRTENRSTARGRPWQTIAIDTMGPFPTDSQGNRYIIVATDMFTRFTELIPSPSNNAATAGYAIWTLIGRYGIPEEILSDNGPEYANRLLEVILQRLQVSHHRTTPFHPQSNGLAERANQEVKRHLRVLCLLFEQYNTWSLVVPYVQYIINTTNHSSTSFAPMAMLLGQHAVERHFQVAADRADSEPETPIGTAAEYITDLDAHIARMCDQARQAQDQRQGDRPEPPLQPGTLVLRRNENPTKLHGHRGPLRVIAVNGYTADVVPLTGGAARSAHVSCLIPVSGDLADEELIRVAATDDEEFYVERILQREDDQLLVKWLGFEEPTWEPIDSPAARTPIGRAFLQEGGSVASRT